MPRVVVLKPEVHQNPLEGPPPLSVSDPIDLEWGRRFCTVLRSFQMLRLMLLVCNHALRTAGLTHSCSTIKALRTCHHLVSRIFLVLRWQLLRRSCLLGCFLLSLRPLNIGVPLSSVLLSPASFSTHFFRDLIPS